MSQPGQPAPRRRRPWKWLSILLGLCLGVGIIGAIVNGPADQPAASAPTALAVPTAAVRAATVELAATPTIAPTVAPATATTAPAPTATSPSAAKDGNLRAGPGTGFAIIGSVSASEPLEIVGRNRAGDWYEVAGGGWIAAFLVANAPENVELASVIPELSTSAPAVRVAPVAPVKSLPGAELSSCDCSGNLYNCDDFMSFDAQSCYMRCLQLTGRDVHDLDRDRDGSACEWEY